MAHVLNITFHGFQSFRAGTKDCSSFIRPRVQKRVKVAKVSLHSQRFKFGPECFALNVTLEQMKQ